MAVKTAGIQLVAIGASEFNDAMIAASAQVNFFSEAVQRGTGFAGSFGLQWQKAFESFKQLGATPLQAINDITQAIAAGEKPFAVIQTNAASYFDIIQNLAIQGKSWAEIQKELNGLTEQGANSYRSARDEAGQLGKALFGVTLLSFGLLSITSELKKSYGDDLPPAFERTTSALQQIASFGAAGAFSGLGVLGVVLGVVTGAVVALGTAASTVSPQIIQLNQNLNNMSKQDETVNTLAKVADVSVDVAQSWEDAARKSPGFAKKLEDIAKAAEPVPPLIAAITTATDTLGISMGNFPDLGQKFNDWLKHAVGDIVELGAIFKEISKEILDEFNSLAYPFQTPPVFLGLDKILEQGRDAKAKAEAEFGSKVQGTDVPLAKQNDLSAEATAINKDLAGAIDDAAKAEDKYSKSIEDANFRLSQLNQQTRNQRDSAQQSFDNSAADAATQRGNAIANADQQWQDRDADLWQEWQGKVAEINSKLSDRVADISTRFQNRVSDIEQGLADKIANIQQELANKLAELAHQREQAIAQGNQKEQQAAEDLARKLYEIERTRIEDTEALAFNTAEQLRSARTEHDREDILRRSQFEKGQIDQKANDARNNAENDYAKAIKQAELEKKLAKDDYDYQVMLAKQLAAQKEAEARRTADEQIKQAQREAAQQIAAAQREQAQALAAAEHRYNEETALAKRSYEEAVAAAIKAEGQKLADARRALEQRNEAITKSYELERAQIQKTVDDAHKAFDEATKVVATLNAQIAQFITNELVALGIAVNFARELANLSLLEHQFAQSHQDPIGEGYFPSTPQSAPLPIVPSPSGGTRDISHTTVHAPNSTSSSNKSITLNMPIYDATDPKKVAAVVRQEFNNAAWQ